MNIIEAAKSGRRFKRESDTEYFHMSEDGFIESESGLEVSPLGSSMLYENWELEPNEPEIVVTRKDVKELAEYITSKHSDILEKMILRKLGFKDE